MLERLMGPNDLRLDRADRDAAIVLLTATSLLVLFFYWGRPGGYVASGTAARVRDLTAGSGIDFVGSGAYMWWGISSLWWRLAVPFGIAWWFLGMRPRDLGLRFRGIGRHWPVYGAMFAVMIPVLVWASSFDSFLRFYPFYSRAGAGGVAFWIYEVGYALQFVGVESFFRGFMTFGLAPRFGLLAVPMMTVPYTMIHFAKPMPEAVAAIVAGLVLGFMALRTRSFVPGIAVHVGVAIVMDLLVLARLGQLGNVV